MEPLFQNVAVIDDDKAIRKLFKQVLAKHHISPHLFEDGEDFLKHSPPESWDLVFLDLHMPRSFGLGILETLQSSGGQTQTIIISGDDSQDYLLRAMRTGASDFLPKPISLNDLNASIARAERARSQHIEQGRPCAVSRQAVRPTPSKLIGISRAIKEVRKSIEAARRAKCHTFLINGETGVGKEVAAREIHRQLRGEHTPYIAVNCPGLPDSLVESELFGHEKGAYTGADRTRQGSIELSHGGTLFLDEVADLSLSAQAKLLRVIENREVRRLGDTRDRHVDFTLIAATNKDLYQLAREDKFRKDLIFRLNVFEMHLPPLRERSRDIPLLIEHFLTSLAKRRGHACAPFNDDAVHALQQYHFPGNIRELKNLVERASIIANGQTITADTVRQLGVKHVRGAISQAALQACIDCKEDCSHNETICPRESITGTHPSEDVADSFPQQTRDEQSQSDETVNVVDLTSAESLEKVLEQFHWNRRRVASELGISYDALRWKIKKFGID